MCEISVVITMFNEEKSIEHTIEQMIEQTFHHYEVILIDDCSSDKTYQIAKSKIKYEPRFKLYRNEQNEGPAFSRNKGLELAKGKYIIFLDADDRYSPLLLERLYKEISEKNAIVACYRSEIIDVRNDSRRLFGQWKRLGKLINEGDSLIIDNPGSYKGISSLIDLTAWSKLILREFLIKNQINFQDIKSFNDLSFALKSCLLANRIIFINETLIEYLQYNVDSISSKRKLDYCPIVKAYDEVLQNKFIKDKKCYNELVNRAIHNIFAIAFEENRSKSGKERILDELKSIYKNWINGDLILDPFCCFALEYIKNKKENFNKKELFENVIYHIFDSEGFVKIYADESDVKDVLSQYSCLHLFEKIKVVNEGNDVGYELRALCI